MYGQGSRLSFYRLGNDYNGNRPIDLGYLDAHTDDTDNVHIIFW